MSIMSEEIKERIADLMRINLSHKNLNADLRKEANYLKDRVDYYQNMCEQLKKENRELRNMGKDFIDEHRNKGNIYNL